MPKLTIDDRAVEVPPGTKVIAAAEELGIFIPRLCYHPALGSVGACRLCAVSFVEGPVRGVRMSCMVDALDGMVVSTTAPEALGFRRQVVEWLMAGHPHDCPVCDEGGHCLLQEMTVSGGHGERRYPGRKRTYRDQDLGPFVQQEMNRCIHCYRCRRFYQEVAGGRDLGVLGLGARTTFGRTEDGPLESPFSGNLIDLCPTGVFTDRVSRFKGRRWDFQRAPSVCIHCSLTCPTLVSARYREVVRVESTANEHGGGTFLCDRGRFGFDYANRWDRPRLACVQGRNVSSPEALRAAAEALSRLPPESVACLGSLRSSLETQGALARLCSSAGWPAPSFFLEEAQERNVRCAAAGLSDDPGSTLADVEAADFVLVVGADPMNEAPVLALAIRQAARKGAPVLVLDPRPVSLPCCFTHLPVGVQDLAPGLGALLGRTLRGAELPEQLRSPRVEGLCGLLRECRRPVIVCGTDVVGSAALAAAAAAVASLRQEAKEAGIFFVLPGPNAFEAAALSATGRSFEALLPHIEAGAVRGLLVVEADPAGRAKEAVRASHALRKLECLVVADCLPTPTARMAGTFLPTQTVFEAGGHFRGPGRELRCARPVHAGGAPILQTGGGDHPPREFRGSIPGGEPLAAWEVLTELERLIAPASSPGELQSWFSLGSDGVLGVSGGAPPIPSASGADWGQEALGGLGILRVESFLGTEELSCYSEPLQQAVPQPGLCLHEADAAQLGRFPGETVTLNDGTGSVAWRLRTTATMLRGLAVIPRHFAPPTSRGGNPSHSGKSSGFPFSKKSPSR